MPQTLRAQPDIVLSALASRTMPNSSEWSYIADLGTGIDAAVQMPQLWALHLDDSTVRLLRRPYNIGLRSNFTYYPNAIAGHRISQTLYLQERLIERDRHCLYYQFDFGLALYTNPYSRSHDPANVFIGSYLNCAIQVGLAYRYRFDNRSVLWLTAVFAHSSNGYLKKPNKGLNYLQLMLGYQLPRKLLPQHLLQRDSHLQVIDSTCFVYHPIRYAPTSFPHYSLLLSYAPAIVRPRPEEMHDHFHYAYTARLGTQYHFNPVRAIGLSADITYNCTHDSLRVINHDHYPLPFYVGLGANYETSYNRLTLHLGMAAYVLRSQQVRAPIYERVGIFYNFRSVDSSLQPFVGVSLKAHYAHIDFIEWHLGLRLF